jgi:cellulose synthase/poly-beta-1,6-N-acetylglucosamine synthase-like glycosyltransferase
VIILETLLWLIAFFVLHTYLFYPLILFVLSGRKTKNDEVKPSGSLKNISVVISLYNEEKTVFKKLDNLRAIDYPASQIEFLFGSDGSTDGSIGILEKTSNMNIRILNFKERRGKAAVLNDLISSATGDIIVFTDANTEFERQTVHELVKHFDDASIGAVSGNLILRSNDERLKTGEHSYWAFENKLKFMESKVNSLLGATGGVYAVRKELFTPLPTTISVTDDFLIPMNILMKGFRTIYEPSARAYEEVETSVAGEYRRKVRIGAQNMNVLQFIAPLFRPSYGFTAFSLWSHKILRWLVPFFLLSISLLLYLLKDVSGCYEIFFMIMLVLWGIGLLGYVADLLKISLGYLGYPYYFIAMNFALFVGAIKAFLGLQKPTWTVVR